MTLENLQKLFDEYYMPYEFRETEDGFAVKVIHGDWKHDHARLNYFMDKWGYELTDDVMLEPSESDEWSSIKYYRKKED